MSAHVPLPPGPAGSTFPRVAAILFDRDGTLVQDLPGNRDPALLAPMPTAVEAVELARRSGAAIGVATNQPGIERGTLTRSEVDALHRQVEDLLGPFDVWEVCPHAPEAGCACRKPEPGLLLAAAARLGVDPRDCVYIGDIAPDVEAARGAGMAAVLVPTPVTLSRDVAAAPALASTLLEAVQLALAGSPADATVPQ